MDHIQEKRASARDWTLRLAEDGVTSCQEHSLSRLEYAAGHTGGNPKIRKPRIRNPESGIRNPESGIRNPESEIRNPESGI